MLQQATATYIEESLEEFVTRFNQARFEADATAKLDATLGDGEAPILCLSSHPRDAHIQGRSSACSNRKS